MSVLNFFNLTCSFLLWCDSSKQKNKKKIQFQMGGMEENVQQFYFQFDFAETFSPHPEKGID